MSTPAALTTPRARPLCDERAEARFAEHLSTSRYLHLRAVRMTRNPAEEFKRRLSRYLAG